MKRLQQIRPSPFLLCAIGWAVPGAGHLCLGRTRTGTILFFALSTMFAIGLSLEGSLYQFDLTQPLVALAALADLGIGSLYFLARVIGVGEGSVIASTHEHGNTFLVVAGLLNILVVLDAYDIAIGRKS